MIHPTYTHKGVNAFLLRLSRAKRSVVVHRRSADYWQQRALNGAGSASAKVAHLFRIEQLHAKQAVEAIERALGVRK